MIIRVISSILLSFFTVASVSAAEEVFYMERFLPGSHYQVVAKPLDIKGDKIEVREFFWYGCSHCYKFEPDLNSWKATIDKDVEFVRSHAWWRNNMKVHAQMFYTAQELKLLNVLHAKMFEAMHVNKNPLKTEDEIMVLFANSGIHKDKFTKVFNSRRVMRKVEEVNQMQRQVKVAGVPTLLINGRYLVKGTHEVTTKQMLEIADFLISKERVAKLKK